MGKTRDGDGLSAEGARRASEADSGSPVVSRGRFSVKRKAAAVVRLLAGEDLETLSRELGVTAATLSGWRDAFLSAGQSALKTRQADQKDDQVVRLRAKIGQLAMENELLYEKIHRMEDGGPLARGRSSR